MNRVLPILFNTEMVRAILDGRKTVTRRIIKPQPTGIVVHNTGHKIDEWAEIKKTTTGGKYFSRFRLPCQPGDFLYVRETFTYDRDKGEYLYKASPETYGHIGTYDDIIWHPSIHMPKEAARIWLKVTDVRVERLQDITPKDAWKEGAMCNCMSPVPDCAGNKTEFIKIWNSTIKKSDLYRYGYNANPWVWVIEFERCEKPEEL